MIVEKHKPITENAVALAEIESSTNQEPEQEEVYGNALAETYKAIRKILEGIREDPKNPESPPYFKTIKLDNGQLSRIKNNLYNKESGVAFPAVFIHFIDVYYNQGASRISEGKGVARIHYVLNRLNNSDDEFEEEGFYVYERIISEIEKRKNEFPSLVSRFQLQYWDQPLTFDDGLQPYWIDYQIWFSDISTYRYKDYVDVYVSCPPFTQHSDQNETANPERLPDNDTPTYDESSGFVQPDVNI